MWLLLWCRGAFITSETHLSRRWSEPIIPGVLRTHEPFTSLPDSLPLSQVRRARSLIALIPWSLPPLGSKAPDETGLSPLLLPFFFLPCGIWQGPRAEWNYGTDFPQKRRALLEAALACYQAQWGPCAFKRMALGCMPFPEGKQCQRGACSWTRSQILGLPSIYPSFLCI